MTEEHAPSIAWAGDASLRLAWPAADEEGAHRCVRAAFAALSASPPPALLDLTPAYATLLLSFDPLRLDARAAEAAARAACAKAAAPPPPPRAVEIPVCYDGDCAPDAEDVARLHGLSPAEVAALHAGATYAVRFLGFSPGFPYLSGLPGRLETPRLPRPRAHVPAGSVGIAGRQTGIYPQATPGGWRLIGRTPLRLFDPARDPPALLALGDRVRFVPVPRARFDELVTRVP